MIIPGPDQHPTEAWLEDLAGCPVTYLTEEIDADREPLWEVDWQQPTEVEHLAYRGHGLFFQTTRTEMSEEKVTGSTVHELRTLLACLDGEAHGMTVSVTPGLARQLNTLNPTKRESIRS